MHVLDENIPDSQRRLLEGWGVHVRQIGQGVGRLGIQDDEIITLLQSLRRVTFFTRDRDFDHPSLCHSAYCLVRLVCDDEAAALIRRLLRHPDLRTQRQRMGLVVRASRAGLHVWQRNAVYRQLVRSER